MTKTNIEKIDDLIAEVRRIAAEKPDFVYQRSTNPDDEEMQNTTAADCLYIHHDKDGNAQGGCIVGQAALNSGFTNEHTLLTQEGVAASDLVRTVLGIRKDSKDKETQDRLTWLDQVQSNQDLQSPFGEAVEGADAVVRL